MNIKENELEIEYAGFSDVGVVRSENQDSFGKFPKNSNNIYQPKGILFITADGMGGHEGGKDASSLAVKTVSEKYFSCSSHKIINCLQDAFEDANSNIYNHSEGKLQLRRMGTTCTSLVINKERAFIAHVGDSRVYKINKESIHQLSSDHTEVEEMYRKGILSKEEAKIHPGKSILVRALGIEPKIEIDTKDNISVSSGDYFLLCSDGLSKVTKEELKKMVLSNSPKDACDKLINLANERGGTDNVTVQIIKIDGQNDQLSTPVIQSDGKISKKLFALGAVAILILTAIIIYLLFAQSSSIEEESPVLPDKNNKIVIGKNLENTDAKTISNIDELFSNAESKYVKKDLDEALKYYQKILESKPLHMGALDGIYKITNQHIKQANKFQKKKEFQRAIIFYNKAIKLKPNDEQILREIKFCKNEIKNSNIEPDTSTPSVFEKDVDLDKPKVQSRKENNEKITLSGNVPNWIINGLSEDDFLFGPNEVTLKSTLRTKKVLSTKSYNDVDFEVDIRLNKNNQANGVGLIVGYMKDKDLNIETYFLISIEQDGNLKLLEFVNDFQKQLLSIPLELDDKINSIIHKIKLKCLGPWIMIYNNQKLLKAWYNKKLVRGKVGLFADKNTYVHFSKIKISNAIQTENKDNQFQSKVN